MSHRGILFASTITDDRTRWNLERLKHGWRRLAWATMVRIHVHRCDEIGRDVRCQSKIRYYPLINVGDLTRAWEVWIRAQDQDQEMLTGNSRPISCSLRFSVADECKGH